MTIGLFFDIMREQGKKDLKREKLQLALELLKIFSLVSLMERQERCNQSSNNVDYIKILPRCQ